MIRSDRSRPDLVLSRHRAENRGQTSLRAATVAVIALLGLAACETADPAAKFGVSAVQFQDVVVPTGFRLRDAANESYSREEAGWRQAHFVYLGPARVEEAMSYVRQRMPQHNWTMVREENLEDAGVRLRFERGAYSADYTFARRDGSTQMVVDYATDYSRH